MDAEAHKLLIPGHVEDVPTLALLLDLEHVVL